MNSTGASTISLLSVTTIARYAAAGHYVAGAFHVHRADTGRQTPALRSLALVEPLVPGLDAQAAEGRSHPRLARPLRSRRGSSRMRPRERRAGGGYLRAVRLADAKGDREHRADEQGRLAGHRRPARDDDGRAA